MEIEARAKRYADRVMLAFSLHLALLLIAALLPVSTYSPFGICLLLVRFLLPIGLLLLPPMQITLPPLLPNAPSGWLDLLPAWALLLLVGLLVPASDTLPDAPIGYLFLQLVVLTPILEELLFRALPLALCKHFDKRVILLLLSILFALLHSGLSKGYALIAGLVLGLGLLLGRGLLFGILLHACNNLFALGFLLLAEHAPSLYQPIYIAFVCFVVGSGVVIAFLRAKRGCYKLPVQVYETEDGAPVPLARLATPIAIVLLVVFTLVTILL